MKREEILEKLKAIIMDQLKRTRNISEDMIVPKASFFVDLRAVFFDVIEIFLSAEEEFNVEIPDEIVHEIKTVDDLLEVISSALAGDKPKLPYQEKNMREAIRKATAALCQEQPDSRPSTSKCEGLHAIKKEQA